MKLPIRFLALSALLAAGMLPALAGPVDGTIIFTPTFQTVTVGHQVSVDIEVDGLGNGISPALAAFDLTVFFNSDFLTPGTVTFSNRLGDPNDILKSFNFDSFVFAGPSLVGVELTNISFLSVADLMAAQNTSSAGFTLATIQFDAIGSGTSGLTSFVASSPDENGNPLNLASVDGSIQIDPAGPSAVPEPAGFLLAGAGLLLVGLSRKLRRP